MITLKPLSLSISLSSVTGNTVSNATCVYVATNSVLGSAKHVMIVVANSAGSNLYSFMLSDPNYVILEKGQTDLVFANTSNAAVATKIAFRN
jgi:hypothetical protein